MAGSSRARSDGARPAPSHFGRHDPALAGGGPGGRRAGERRPAHHADSDRRATAAVLSPYARGVHLRGAVAAAAGVFAAATAHALDVSGRLPFVHESVNVRTAMSPAQ